MKSKIGELIDEAGLRSNFIAQKCGVSSKQVYNWKKGLSYPTFEKAFILASVLKCKVDDLATLEEDEQCKY